MKKTNQVLILLKFGGSVISHQKNHVTYHLLNGIRDEYEGDEAGETLLCEAGHVLDNVAGV